MRNTIVEDRILARVARDAIGWDDGSAATERADIALGRAVVALRVLGIVVTTEVTQALRDDISLVLVSDQGSQSSCVHRAPTLDVAA